MTTAVDRSVHPEWDRVQRTALLAAAGGVVVFALVAGALYVTKTITTPAQLLLSYLVGYQFWLGIGLGCLVILMLQHLTGGAWGLMLRRILESSSRTLLLLAILFLPLLLGVRSIYAWASDAPSAAIEPPSAPQPEAKGGAGSPPVEYMNVPLFVVRSVAYFLIWLGLAFFLVRWSADQEIRDRATNRQRRFRMLSAPGLVLYGATITLASVDWVMSLEPHWYSTIYPVLFATGQVLTAFAFAVAVLVLLATRPPLAEVVTREGLRDLGSLLLAFVMFWAYMSVSQFLLIWVGNLPEEIPWYLRRIRGGWQWIALLVVVFHFSLPFLLLLSRDIKEHGRRLAVVAVGILVMRFIDIFWWIEPAYRHPGQYIFWLLDLSALVAVGGVWIWVFIAQLRKLPLLPTHDPSFAEALPHA